MRGVNYSLWGSWDSAVGIVTSDWTTEKSWLDSQQGQIIFLFSKTSRPGLGPTQPLIQWVPRTLPARRVIDVKVTPHLQPVPRLGITGAMPLFPCPQGVQKDTLPFYSLCQINAACKALDVRSFTKKCLHVTNGFIHLRAWCSVTCNFTSRVYQTVEVRDVPLPI